MHLGSHCYYSYIISLPLLKVGAFWEFVRLDPNVAPSAAHLPEPSRCTRHGPPEAAPRGARALLLQRMAHGTQPAG